MTKPKASKLFLTFERDYAYSIVIDAAARCIYAYLLKGEEGVGHVWLFNTAKAPASPPWDGPKEGPFMCPEGYAADLTPLEYASDDEFGIAWNAEEPEQFAIYYQERLLALLWDGGFPGKRVGVLKNSPIALPWQLT